VLDDRKNQQGNLQEPYFAQVLVGNITSLVRDIFEVVFFRSFAFSILIIIYST
jgi:hypothetical protein